MFFGDFHILLVYFISCYVTLKLKEDFILFIQVIFLTSQKCAILIGVHRLLNQLYVCTYLFNYKLSQSYNSKMIDMAP